VVGIDMGQHQQLELALIGGQSGEARFQRVPGELAAAVDQDAARVGLIAILDPQAIALAPRQHIDAEDAHRFTLSLIRITVNAWDRSSRSDTRCTVFIFSSTVGSSANAVRPSRSHETPAE
jgi:hypothetical protein